MLLRRYPGRPGSFYAARLEVTPQRVSQLMPKAQEELLMANRDPFVKALVSGRPMHVALEAPEAHAVMVKCGWHVEERRSASGRRYMAAVENKTGCELAGGRTGSQAVAQALWRQYDDAAALVIVQAKRWHVVRQTARAGHTYFVIRPHRYRGWATWSVYGKRFGHAVAQALRAEKKQREGT